MTGTVFLVVLLAAFIHAAWNAAAKGSGDKMRFMAGLVLGHAPFAAAFQIAWIRAASSTVRKTPALMRRGRICRRAAPAPPRSPPRIPRP